MSDAEDSGFDKEAEREKLREKYEAEQEDRQATQHMSELLLQGATMTNRHCDACGNPIFRYDGEEFCPVCGEEAADGAGAGAGAEEQAGAGAGGQPAEQSDDQPGQRPDGQQAAQSQEPASGRDQPAREQPSRERASQGQPAPEQPTPEQPATEQPAAPAKRQVPTGPPAVPQGAEGADAGEGDLAEARASLVRTLTDLTRRAEQSRDVGHTRELLAAAREAAETLAALDRTGR